MEESVHLHHPLFSCFITLYTLILLYFPIQFLLSPVLLLSGSLLLSLLRLGSNTRPGKTHSVNLEEESRVLVAVSETKLDSSIVDFVEWDLRAPLEVIHEDDDEENPSVSGEKDPTRFSEMERFPSLSLCYPESDSDSSSEFTFPEMGDNWISPEKMGLGWEEEEEDDENGFGGEGLIEIKLDHRKISKWNETEFDFHAEDEGLIEIDIFS